MSRSRLLFLGQLLLGLFTLSVLLLRRGLWAQVLDLLAGFDWVYLPLLAVFSLLFIGISSTKWQLFLRNRGFDLTLGRLMRLYTIGVFFNNFLPSMVGGDVARSVLLGRDIDSQSRSAATVFLERFTGLVALVVLAVSTVIINPTLLSDDLVLFSLVVLGGSSMLLLLLVLRPQIWQGNLGGLGEVGWIARLQQFLSRLHANVNEIQREPALFRSALLYSFAFHLLAGLNAYVAALALGASPNLLEMLTLVPLTLLVSSIPVTPNGIGIFEWAFSLYLVPAGLSPAQGLAVAGIVRAKNLVVSLFGGVFFLTSRASGRRRVDLRP